MEPLAESESSREIIRDRLRRNFGGKIVRKDLTKKIKEGSNVPVYDTIAVRKMVGGFL